MGRLVRSGKRGLADASPMLMSELADVLADCVATSASAEAQACRDRFFSWKVVGIPKRCEAAVRPIAIAIALMRAFHRALLRSFPALPSDQYCGAPGASAASACMAWLNTPAHGGTEFDLRKAFDSVVHRLAVCAGSHAGLPSCMLQYFRTFVWSAPRFCVVHGQPPASPVLGCCGLPAGDPCSPHFLAFLLAPWGLLMRLHAGVTPYLYMDDRSLLTSGSMQSLNDAPSGSIHALSFANTAASVSSGPAPSRLSNTLA